MIRQLGYLVFEASDLDAWANFGDTVLGFDVARDADELRFRMDARAHRFVIERGPLDDLKAVGWEVSEPADLDALVDRLEKSGVPAMAGTVAECAARGVERMVKFHDPAGTPAEAFFGAQESAGGPDGFVAGDLGLGHIVLSAKDKGESVDFYRDLLGFRVSDHIVCDVYGYPVDITFFHVNARHHSLAIGGPMPKRLHHFMVETRSVDEVGLGHDRVLQAGLQICQTIGRHPNDRMLSFYATTPSGFQFELGYDGRMVDDASWEVTTYDRISEWGHHPPKLVGKGLR